MNINETATTAANANLKCNKKDAYLILLDTINNGGTLSELDAAKLYKYFAPATPKKAKTAFDYVARGVGKKDVRYYLNHINVKDGTLSATNGHVLFQCDTTLADGFYNNLQVPLDNTGNAIGVFPDVERIKPSGSKTSINILNDVENLEVRLFEGRDIIIIKTDSGETAFDKGYYDSALNDVVNPNISINGEYLTVEGSVDGVNTYALVMAVRLKPKKAAK